MATKDWRRNPIAELSDKHYYKNKKTDAFIKIREQSGYNPFLLVIEESNLDSYQTSFKTESEAFKFAKSYMRTH